MTHGQGLSLRLQLSTAPIQLSTETRQVGCDEYGSVLAAYQVIRVL